MMRPYIKFIRPMGIAEMKLVRISDASHGAEESIIGQSGNFCELHIPGWREKEYLPYFVVDETQSEKCKMFHIWREISAASDSVDREYDLKCSLKSLSVGMGFPHEVLADLRAVFETITSSNEPRTEECS